VITDLGRYVRRCLYALLNGRATNRDRSLNQQRNRR
jgi:hypothetical protein